MKIQIHIGFTIVRSIIGTTIAKINNLIVPTLLNENDIVFVDKRDVSGVSGEIVYILTIEVVEKRINLELVKNLFFLKKKN